jgi:hypothetical protein
MILLINSLGSGTAKVSLAMHIATGGYELSNQTQNAGKGAGQLLYFAENVSGTVGCRNERKEDADKYGKAMTSVLEPNMRSYDPHAATETPVSELSIFSGTWVDLNQQFTDETHDLFS